MFIISSAINVNIPPEELFFLIFSFLFIQAYAFGVLDILFLFNIGQTFSQSPQLMHLFSLILGYLKPFSSSIISIAFLGHILEHA